MNSLKKFGIFTLAIIMGATSLTGCSSVFEEDATQLPLVAALSEKEVIDYYAKSLSYDSIVTKNLDVDRVLYETKDVEEQAKIKKLQELQKKTEKALGEMNYTYSEELAEILDENTLSHIKHF